MHQASNPTDRRHVTILDALYYVLPRLNQNTVQAVLRQICQRTVQLFMVTATSVLKVASQTKNEELVKHELGASS